MKTRSFILTLSLILLSGFSAFSSKVVAKESDKEPIEVQAYDRVMVEVKGVVCSFCAYGTEKNLARLKFIDPSVFGDGVLLDLKKAMITLAVKPDQKVEFEHIVKAIKKGGYDPVAIHLKLAGKVFNQDGRFLLKNKNNAQIFRLVDSKGQPWNDKGLLEKEVIFQGVIPVSTLAKGDSSQEVAVQVKSIQERT
jgi:hypothetical protein